MTDKERTEIFATRAIVVVTTFIVALFALALLS